MLTKNNSWIKLLSLILVISLLTTSLPSQVFAAAGDVLISAFEHINANEAVALDETTGQALYGTECIVKEDESKRGEFYKEFILNNGLRLATIYPSAIHYEKDGKWKEIDNTLIAAISNGNAIYTNTAGKWNVRFPQNLSGNSMIGITKDGFTVQFGMAGELRSSGGLVVASAGQIGSENISETLSVSSAQTSSAQVQQLDLTDAMEAAEYPETVPDKLNSRLVYNNVYSNTNVVYDLQGNQLKESIILQQYDEALWGYRYTLDTGDLIPVMNDEQQINLCDPVSGEIIMTMPAPYLVDNNGEYNYDVEVSLVSNGGSYLLSYYLPRAWLADADRTWPVILDPIISADGSYSNMRDRTIAETVEEAYNLGSIRCGYHEDYGKMWIFMQYVALPAITSADVVVEATITLRKLENSSASAVVEVHKVEGTWDSETITWANKPDHNESVEDYTVCLAAGSYTWTITDIVRDWYASANTGMMFKISNEEEAAQTANWKQFASSDYDSTSTTYMPMLNIKFRNANGLEDYWDYTSASVGRAGTGYVNNYNGNLVWVRNDIGFGGNRMPVSISHVYNANDAQNNLFGMGYGWRTNYNQRVYVWEEDNSYYVWEDSDGTLHYFYQAVDESGNAVSDTYLDEDGLYLTLTTGGTGDSTYILEDQYGNKSYFNAAGRLVKIANNQETESCITITYKSVAPHLIDVITDGAGRKYYFTYTNYLLKRISYKSSGSSEISYVTFTHSNSQLTRITDADGKYATYTYGGRNLLLSAQDYDGSKVAYTYNLIDTTALLQPSRVATVTEYDTGGTAGGQISIEYANNQTTFTDHNGNKQIIQFNNWGNPVAIMDNEGKGQFVSYRPTEAETDKGNHIDLSSKLQNTVSNLLSDNSFERGTVWTNINSSVTHTIISGTGYHGSKSLCMVRTTAGAASGVMSAEIQRTAGDTYTFSAYVKTGSGSTAYLAIRDSSGDIVKSDTLPANSGWTRLEVTYTSPTSNSIYAQLMTTTAGTVYMDCVQLEKAPTASRYNLVDNGDFRFDDDAWSPSTTADALEDSCITTTTAAPQMGGQAYQLTGKPESELYLKQTVAVSGSKDDVFVLTGWARGDSAPLTGGNRAFCLRGVFVYEGDAKSEPFDICFNPDTDSSVNWQYAAGVMVAPDDYIGIEVYLVYSYNVNTMFFDGIQLYKEQFGYAYTYDSRGNITEARDLQGGTTVYTYDETTNNLMGISYPDGTTITYTYYTNSHNLKTATSSTGVTYTYVYDTYGNNTSVSIGSGSTTITSTADYTDDGNRLEKTTDTAGNETIYTYNADTNVLESVQYPQDSESNTVSQTTYTYDAMYRVTSTVTSINSGSNLTASYTYDAYDRLTNLATASTTYTFTYDSFGLRSKIQIGTRTLAEYTYDTQDHTLSRLDYGNENRVQYTYDDLGRVIRADYYPDGEEGTVAEGYITYDYDTNGALATVYDSATGRTTTYYYDEINRLIRYVEASSGYAHSVGYSYDELDYLTTLTETIDGVTRTTSYTYDNDNRISTVTNGTNVLTYTYDAYGRQSTMRYSVAGSTLMTRALAYRTTSNGTTSQVRNLQYVGASLGLNLTYDYDANGNIISVSDGTYTTTYEYDDANQLTRENNQAAGKTWVWTYDDAGNILTKTEYAYTTNADPGTAISSPNTYTYPEGTNVWGDLLTAYNGVTISYDANGNPLSDGTWSYTWERGRQLKSMTNGSTTWTFTYDASGMRTKRTNGTTTYSYVYNGSSLSKMTVGSNVLYFTYDAAGSPATVTYNNVVYYYATNLQGDVLAIVNSSGTEVVRYTYDAWGKLLTTTGSLASTLGAYNPLRYRGYVYDRELGLYYLQSRYYDPDLCRFLNADAYVSTGQGELGNNMFAYCINNPVNGGDPCGTCFHHWQFWKDCAKCAASKAESKAQEEAQTIKYNVPLYNQGGLSLCWAFCQTMMESYNSGSKLTQKQAKARAIKIAQEYHGSTKRKDWNNGGWPSNLGEYVGSIGSIEELYNILQANGPVYAYYSTKDSAHIVIVTGVNLYSGVVYTNNPWGVSGVQSFEEFQSGFATKWYHFSSGKSTSGALIYLMN